MNSKPILDERPLPNVAISIRQPWAWLAANGYKDIENRTWTTKFRGLVLIHASSGMTRKEYDEACNFAVWADGGCELKIPPFETIERGGIVGVAEIVDCVRQSSSRWFIGPHGFFIRDAHPLPFTPMKGYLGIFKIEKEIRK